MGETTKIGLFGQPVRQRRAPYRGHPCYCRQCKQAMTIIGFGGEPLEVFPVDKDHACDVCRGGDTGRKIEE